jgi:signal peptidase I, bacterial type
MTAIDPNTIPKCWSQRLWWPLVLASMVTAYFVLRNYTLTYWQFMISFAAFIAVGASIGNYLGAWIDRRFRSERGLLRQERGTSNELLKWLHNILRKHEHKLEPKVARKLRESIERLETLVQTQATDRLRIMEERGKLQALVEEHLTQFRSGVLREYVEPFAKAALIALLLRAFVVEPFQIPSGSMVPTIMFGDHIFANKLAYGVRVPLLPMTIAGHEIEAIAWNWSIPSHGDIIVFVTPENKIDDYIKRVVALPEEEILVRDGVIFINGKPFEQTDQQSFEFNDLDSKDGSFIERVSTKKFDENVNGLHHPILKLTRCNMRSKCDCTAGTGFCRQEDYGPYTVPPGHVFCMGDNRDSSKDSRFWGPVPLEYIKGKAEFIWWSYRENQVRWDRMFMSMY